MADIEADDIVYDQRGPGRTLQEVFDGDAIPPPEVFREDPSLLHS